MVSIARKNLFEDLPRFMVAQAGIMFAVGLVTIQTGLLDGFTKSASLLVDNSKADIWVASKDMRYLELTIPLPYERLAQAQRVEGVDRAEALITRGSLWRRTPGAQIDPIRLIGFDPDGQLFSPWRINQGNISDLKQPYTVMIDRSDLKSLDVNTVGDTAEIGSVKVTVKGFTQGIHSIVASPFVFSSLPNANYYFVSQAMPTGTSQPANPSALTAKDQITYILVRAKPGQNLTDLKSRLEAALPDTRAFTLAEMSQLNQTYWRRSTGVGFILGMGAAVGVVVGMVVVGQILYSSVSDHLQEFGTLKAMGSSNWYIYRVIIEQALWMAVLGYLPGMGLCLGLATWTMQTRAIAILITPSTAIAVFGMTIVMCTGAAAFAIRKVTYLDPAMVFKS
jgi:putative ABC transport system permease protein